MKPLLSSRGRSFTETLLDVLVPALIISGLVTSVLLGAALVLGSAWLVLWIARQIVGLMQ